MQRLSFSRFASRVHFIMPLISQTMSDEVHLLHMHITCELCIIDYFCTFPAFITHSVSARVYFLWSIECWVIYENQMLF